MLPSAALRLPCRPELPRSCVVPSVEGAVRCVGVGEGVFHVKHEGWSAAAAALGVELPVGGQEQLDTFERLLLERGAPMGVVSRADVERVRERHVLDCLRAAPLVVPPDAVAYDLGSGGGLPGLVLAIAVPSLRVTLVEVRHNRGVLLESMITDLGLRNASVYGRRAETLREPVDLVFARAFAPPGRVWAVAEPLLKADGRLIYWAGERFDPTRDAPKAVKVDLFRTPALAESGTLAIMSQQ
jgi:16S rRNA (guanine527-N7)-methyltransferase